MKAGNLIQNFLSERVLPIWCIFLLDIFLVGLSVFLSCLLRYDFTTVFSANSILPKAILWIVLVNIFFFRIFHTYANIIRYSSFVDIMRIFVSLTVSFMLLVVTSIASEIGFDYEFIPISILFISYVFSFAALAGMRVCIKVMYEFINFDDKHGTNVFIFGTREYGVDIAKSIRSKSHYKYRLKGFISSDPVFYNKVIMGVKVYPFDDEDLMNVLEEKNTNAVIVTPYNMDKLKESNFTEQLLKRGIKIMVLPDMS